MDIVVITYDYPDKRRPVYPFVKALVDEWGKSGHRIIVISPFSVTRAKRLIRFDELWHPDNIIIIRPKILSFSDKFRFKGRSLTDRIHEFAILKVLKRMKSTPDMVYCHFWKEAIFAYSYVAKNNIPLVVASGESIIPSYLKREPYRIMCNRVNKVICASSKNMRESIDYGLTTEDKCIILPNAIDNELFKVTNQSGLKRKLGINNNDFVVVFVGWFNERKGAKRVSDALTKINNPNIKAIFLGSGTEEPDCPGLLLKCPVPHNNIPDYLNCADIFVLPTLREGCCNAIVEAMACGLPIISSNLEFNWDILDETNSVLLDPTDVDAIAMAINGLYNDKDKCHLMRKASLKKAKRLHIANRAQAIIDFINK